MFRAGSGVSIRFDGKEVPRATPTSAVSLCTAAIIMGAGAAVLVRLMARFFPSFLAETFFLEDPQKPSPPQVPNTGKGQVKRSGQDMSMFSLRDSAMID